MKYLIELVADPKGLEPAITAMDELNAKEKELKATTTQVSAEQKKMMDDYAAKAKLGKGSIDKLIGGYKQLGKAATGAFGKDAIVGATKAAESFRTQLRNSREELTKLFVEGKATTAEIYRAAQAGAGLSDAIGDAQQAITVLASDTFKFDAAIQGVQLGAAGFQALTAGAALFGDESEDLQKTLVKLNGVMALTQSLQQIVNLTQKQSAFSLGVSVAAQRLYAIVLGQSTGALALFRIALAATGIGLAVFAIVELVKNWDRLKRSIGFSTISLKEYNAEQEKTNAIAEEFNDKLKTRLEYEVAIGDKTEKEKDLLLLQNDVAQLRAKNAELERQKTILNELEQSNKNRTSVPGLPMIQFGGASHKDIEAQKQIIAKLNDEILKKGTEVINAAADLREKDNKKEIASEKETNNKIDELYREALKHRRDLQAENERLETEEREKQSQLRLQQLRDQLKKEEDIYRDSLKNRRDIEAENESIRQEFLKEQSQIRFERRRDEINAEISSELEKQQTIKDTSIEVAQITADAIFQIVNTNRNNEFNAQIQRLNELKNKELSNKELSDAQRARIEERYQRKIAEIKAKQARADKAAAISQAIVNGALAITKILTSVTVLNPAAYAAIAITAASTAAQVAVIAAQKIPKFAKGTEFVHGAGTGTSDSVPAMLSRGERVIDAKTNKLLKGIPNKLIPDLLIPQHTMIKEGMDYDKLAKAFSKELSNNPALMVNFDRQGFTTFIKSGVTTSQIKNNRNGI